MITRLLSRHSFLHYIEILLIELNLRKKKWLLYCCYNPHKKNYHVQELANLIQICCKRKKKYLRANHSKFATKKLSKAIMLKSKLRKNREKKDKTEESRCKYKKTKKCLCIFIKKSQQDYYENINISNLIDSNKFWQMLQPIFGSKI